MNTETGNHYLAYAFPCKPTVEGRLDGGLPAAILRQMRIRHEEPIQSQSLHILSPDDEPLEISSYGVQIVPADPETVSNADRYGFWFGDMWVVLHPKAHTSEHYPDEILEKMFPNAQHTHPVGSLERAIEHVERFGFAADNPRVEEYFSQRFDAAIANIPPGSIINWQDYMFSTTIRNHAEGLRQRGCFQTFHLHTALPEELHRFKPGRDLLEAMSKMDVVYVHTDVYQERLEEQLILLGLPMPKIRRFDLGIDEGSIKRRLEEVRADTYRKTPEYQEFSPEQQRVIDEIVSTQNRDDLHRFIVLDRADQGKGQTIVLDAMDEYLQSLSEEERLMHRFYFVMPQLDWPLVEHHPQRQYIDYLRKRLAQVKAKYPYVLYYTHGVSPKFTALLAQNAHAITGGVQDGLCLAPQEILKVNALTGKNRSAIIGMGTGFAMQTIRTHKSHAGLIHFVRQGEKEAMLRAIQDIVMTEQSHPEQLGNNTVIFVTDVIDKRRDGVVVVS